MRSTQIGLTICFLLFAKPTGGVAQTEASCAPTTARSLPEASTFDVGTLVGQYALTLVATSGDRTGRRTQGAVTLVRSDSSDRGKRLDGSVAGPWPKMDAIQPVYGWANVSLADVGAISERDPRSRDPMYPGVMLRSYSASDFNRREAFFDFVLGGGTRDSTQLMVHTLDGPITHLQPSVLDGTGIIGTWSSGSLVHAADGYFCLRRTSR